MPDPVLLWFRQHLRLADNPASAAPLPPARGRAEGVIPALAQAISAGEVPAGWPHGPSGCERDCQIAAALSAGGRKPRLVTSTMLQEPARVPSGGDAAPNFRLAPELAELADRFLHRPREAPVELLAGAGVALGLDYRSPVLDHPTGCALALATSAGLGEAASA